MKKQLLVILLFLMVIVVAACSSGVDGAHAKDGTNSKEETKDANSTDEKADSSGTGPLIDPDHALDERQSIITTIEEQKEKLKLGFITEDMTVDSIFMQHFTDMEFVEREQSNYSVTYRSDESDRSVYYSNEIWACEDGLDEWTKDLENRKEFKADRVEGYYGHVEYGDSSLAVKHDDHCYSVSVMGEDDEYDEADARFLELMSKTFKTEEEGAYDPFYSRFTLDLNNIKFPSLNEDRAVLRDTWLSYEESKFDPSFSVAGAAYFIGDEFLMYEVTDEEEPYAMIKSEEELQTETGVTVRKIEEENVFNYLYIWNDGTYNYVLEVDMETSKLPESDILEIVDSAMADERSFDSLDFLSSVTETPNLGKDEQEIIANYY